MSELGVVTPVAGALSRIRRRTGVPLAFGGLVEAGSNLRLKQFVGTTRGALDGVLINAGHGLGGKVTALGRPMSVDDYVGTRSITHRYDSIISREGLRAMAAAPVIVDRRPVAVLYGALHTADPIGSRTLEVLADEARAVEQEVVASRATVEHAAGMTEVSALRDRLDDVYAQLRVLARTVDDRRVAAELTRIYENLTDDSESPSFAVQLTAREVDVLSLAALGYGNARIAEVLGVAVGTVKGYVKDAMRKLGATTRLEAVVVARRGKLLP